MLTALHVDVRIKPDSEIAAVILDMIAGRYRFFRHWTPAIKEVARLLDLGKSCDHPFFFSSEWTAVFTEFKSPHPVLAATFVNDHLKVDSSFREYDHEVPLFTDWIKPHLDLKYTGNTITSTLLCPGATTIQHYPKESKHEERKSYRAHHHNISVR